MAMVVNNRLRIHYRYEGERGAFLLLHHGLFGSTQDWYASGYVKALEEDFRLIIPDARGHGRSDRPTDPALYSPAQMADDIIAVMDEMKVHNLHFLGYSIGAMVGFELLTRYPDRMRIVMFAGEAPFVMEGHNKQWGEWAGRLKEEGLERFTHWLNEGRLCLAPQPRMALPDEKPEAIQEGAQAMLDGLAALDPRPSGKINVSSPVALFTADKDPAHARMLESRKEIHRARLVTFPGKDHRSMFEERESLLDELHRLLKTGKREGVPSRAGAPAKSWNKLTPPPPVDVGDGAGEETEEAAADEEARNGATAAEKHGAGAQDAPHQDAHRDAHAAEGEGAENGFEPVKVRTQEEVVREPDEEEGPEYPEELQGASTDVEYVEDEDDDEGEEEEEEEAPNHGRGGGGQP